MKKLTGFISIAMPVLLIWVCISDLHDSSFDNARQTDTKRVLQSYAPQQHGHVMPDAVSDEQSSSVPHAGPEDIEIIIDIPDNDSVTACLDCEDASVQPVSYETAAMPAPNTFISDLRESVNADIAGWLSIHGTEIDYPVLMAGDNEHYSKHDIYGYESRSGSIFMDYRCAPDFSGPGTVIYGHNMKNNSMFGRLRSYANPVFFDEHRTGTLYTSTAAYCLDIFAYMVTSSDDPQVYANIECAEPLLIYVQENARIYRERGDGICNTVPDSAEEKIIILSTCAYEFENARIVVLARAVKCNDNT